jgi:hypothetical protein
MLVQLAVATIHLTTIIHLHNPTLNIKHLAKQSKQAVVERQIQRHPVRQTLT